MTQQSCSTFDTDVIEVGVASDQVVSPEEELKEEKDLEEDLEASGFCKDDIYSKYLIRHYKKINKAKRYKSRRSRRNYKFKRETQSLHYAVSRLQGPMKPYFGGIPVVSNRRVAHWISFFQNKGRRSFLKWMARGAVFKKTIGPILLKEGVPEELFYLAMVESGFNNRAYSKASATGAWQFMGGTARRYGLQIDYWVDERRDLVKSTKAASGLLKDLYARFGDWYLAMAAYNAGPGKISRAIRKTKSRNFWKIADSRYIRSETKNYVPKMLAALTLASNPREYGFAIDEDLIEHENLGLAVIDRPVRLKEVALKLGYSLKKIRKWNPELTRDLTPPKRLWSSDKGYSLVLPQKSLALFERVKNDLTHLEIKDIKTYHIKSGDTLSQVARKFKVSVRKILNFNPKLSPRRLRIGKKIAIPVPSVVTHARKSKGKKFG